jgi:predicted PurR-regulated permease PerM
VPTTFSLVLGFAAMPIFLFFVLKDAEKLSCALYSALPSWMAKHAENIVVIVEGVLGRYIRAQLMLGLVVSYIFGLS